MTRFPRLPLRSPRSRQRALRWLLAALLLVGLAGWRLLGGRPAAQLPQFAAPTLEVLPSESGVTFRLSAAVGGTLPGGVPLRLVLATPAGPLQRLGRTQPGQTDLSVPYVRAGLTGYDLSVAGHRFSGWWRRSPGPAVTPLRLKVGARAVRVVGDPPPALVLHPQDAQGNVGDEPVSVRVQQPGARSGDLWTRLLPVRHLLAWSFLPVGSRTGTLEVAASVGDAHGERAEVDLLPGPAATARLTAGLDRAPASGRDAWQLALTDLRDELGNPVLDGSSVTLLGNGPQHLSVTRPAVGGAVRLSLPAAVVPGEYRVQALAGSSRSGTLALTSFRPVETVTFPLALVGSTVQVGSVLTPLGALPDNGTAVHLRLLGQGGEVLSRQEGALTDGAARFTLPSLPAGARALEVEVGGQRSGLPLEGP